MGIATGAFLTASPVLVPYKWVCGDAVLERSGEGRMSMGSYRPDICCRQLSRNCNKS